MKAKTLLSVIDFVLTEFPDLEPKLAWNVPTLHRSGKYIIGLVAYKNHFTISLFSGDVIEEFKTRLRPDYRVFKNCFQVPADWKIDKDMTIDLVKTRLAEFD